MSQASEGRRLLAILVADIVGYSGLMARFEAETFHKVKELQASLILPSVARNRGKVVKWTGDGFIATFESALDAVRAAVEVQSGAKAASAATSEDRRLRFRMGVNVGDVIVVPGDVYGDSVNVAARLQGVAEPDGICVSRGVRDTVRGKFEIEFTDLGDLEVKNIPDPVGTYALKYQPVAWTMERDVERPARTSARKRVPMWAVAAAVLVVGALAMWAFVPRPRTGAPEAAVHERTAGLAQPFQAQVLARLAEIAPTMPQAFRTQATDQFLAEMPHRALVAAPRSGQARAFSARDSAERATERALEVCELQFGEPCAVVAVNDHLPPRAEPRAMERVGYAGPFNPLMLPSDPAAVQRSEVLAYRGTPGPRAVALHVLGQVYVVTGAPSQHAAEERALAACAADTASGSRDLPCFLYAVADEVVLARRSRRPLSPAPAPATPAPAAADALRAELANRLATVAPRMAAQPRAEAVEGFLRVRPSRALAVAPQRGGNQWTGGFGSAAEAEVRVLEQCQVSFGEPCILVALNDRVLTDRGPTSMPRPIYAGLFDPPQVPMALALQARPDVQGYRAAPGPKAVALYAGGSSIYVVTGAPDQRTAEERALAACTADPIHGGRLPCFLYAVGDQVVLQRRASQPITAAPSASPPASAPAAGTPAAPREAPTATLFRDAMLGRIGQVAPEIPEARRREFVELYSGERTHRAFAIAPRRAATWRMSALESEARAEERALEGCQLYYGEPCVAVAVNDTLAPAGTNARDMPRVTYAGIFDPAQVPGPASLWTRANVVGYRAAPNFKAAAIHPFGVLTVVTGAASQREAEERALQTCTTDPNHGGRNLPCYLYATGDEVVLPRRRSQPITPPSPAPITGPDDPARRQAEQDRLREARNRAEEERRVAAAREAVQREVAAREAVQREAARVQDGLGRPPAATPAPQVALLPPPVAPPPPPASAPVPSRQVAVPPAPPPLRDQLQARASAIAPRLLDRIRDEAIDGYLRSPTNRGLAAAPNRTGLWRSQGWMSAERAEERVLEGCQIFYGEPCVLVSVNETVTGGGTPRSMPRATYAGTFDPRQLPTPNELRTRTDVVAYAQTEGPKAVAIHPWGGILHIVTNAPDQRTAEERALAACATDPAHGGRDLPCFLYASGNQVVLPRRATQGITAR